MTFGSFITRTAIHRFDGQAKHVQWFNRWHPIIDDALQELPEMDTCPHELFRLLMESRASVPKRIALVTDAGRPVAVVGLRRRQHHWEPIPQGVVPHALAVARDEHLFPALASLKVNLRIPYWQQDQPPPRCARDVIEIPVHKMDCTVSMEPYWRTTGHLKTIKSARNRTRGFTLEVDAPGAAEWTIKQWADRWGVNRLQTTSTTPDLLVAARFDQSRGRYHSFRLMDGDNPVAGCTFVVYKRELSLVRTIYRLEYNLASPGHRLLELVHDWARIAGYSQIDIGGGQHYKAKTAPESGILSGFNICPLHIAIARQSRSVARTGMKTAKFRMFRWLRTQPTSGAGARGNA